MGHETVNIFQTILESMGEGIIYLDADDRLAFINHTAEEIRGIKAVNYIGRNILSFHSPRTAERIGRLLAGFRDGSQQQSRRVIEVKGKYFENSYYPIRHPDGSYLGTLLISRDVTEKQQLKAENQLLREQMCLGSAFEDFIGTSQAILQVFRTITAIAPLDSTIMINGESGTGKELVATAIHRQSRRADKAMIKVNCAALPEHLVESELFGHERGAFTGAISSHRGKFEQAHGGTLFLDEVGDLPLGAQAKLLRVLQERCVVRLGSEKELRVDVRILAATNKDLLREVAEGRFREDLFYRLNVIAIDLPPLRQRREDILPLARHYLQSYAARMERDVPLLGEAAAELLTRHDYPGNVRELQHAMERAMALCRGGTITPDDLPPAFSATAAAPPRFGHEGDAAPAAATAAPLARCVDDFERQLIRDALSRTGGRKADAARLLNISRKTLWLKLKQFGDDETLP